LAAHFDFTPFQAPLLFLVAAGVVVPLFKRLRLSPVLGFLLAGVLIGPHGLGRLNAFLPVPFLDKTAHIAVLAEFGVVFLMFNMGLELSLERLVLLRRYVFGFGAAQVAACGLALMFAARLFGLSWPASATLAIALALSSTAVVVPVLAERKRLNSFSGRAIFSVLLFQDLLVAPLLLVMSMSAEGGRADLWWTLASAFFALAVIAGVGRIALRPFFHLVAAARSNDLFIAACLLVVVATAVAAAAAGLSMALGAFIAGLLLAETEFRRAVELTIEPFKGLLLGLFFVSVGADLDPVRILAQPLPTLGLALGLTALKAPIVAALAFAFGAKGQKPREIGLLLAPGGEFAFLILGAAAAAGVLSSELAGDAMIGVTLSMAFIPPLGSFAMRAQPAPRLRASPPENLAPASRVLIVGYGRVGQVVTELMRVHKIDYLCIDDDSQVAAAAREKGDPVYWGDATRPDFLANCGLATARAVVVTMHTPSAVDAVVRIAREARPDLTIVARARDALHARHLYALGATDAVPETVEASLQLSEAALVDIGVPMGLVIASIHEQRDVYRKALIAEGDVAATATRPFSARRKKR
jgi:CPA2 family monovalent cation:H+ antiporter-2